MIREVTGIVINEIPYGDTSKIINVFTENLGIIGIIAKGAKSVKSHLRNVTEKYTYGKFYIYYKEDKLSILSDVDIIDNFKVLKNDIVLFGYLAYVVDLCSQVYKQNNSNEIYNLMLKTLKKMNNDLNPLVLTNILEIKLLDYAGVALNLNECALCGNKTNIITINGDAGGYICTNCRTNEIIYDEKTIKMLRMYYYVEIDSITSLNISDSVVKNINDFLDLYYERYTGLYLKSKKFLKNVINL